MLRDIPKSVRYFWASSLDEQTTISVFDRDKITRKLPGNEITVMALNEIAYARGRGFFSFLANRLSYKTQKVEQQPG